MSRKNKERLDELARITNEELSKPSVRKELDKFYAEILPDEDFLSMEDLKVEDGLRLMKVKKEGD